MLCENKTDEIKLPPNESIVLQKKKKLSEANATATTATTTISTINSGELPSLEVELQWGVGEVENLYDVWVLHEHSFPIAYPLWYYQRLLGDGPKTDNLTICAFIKYSVYQESMTQRCRELQQDIEELKRCLKNCGNTNTSKQDKKKNSEEEEDIIGVTPAATESISSSSAGTATATHTDEAKHAYNETHVKQQLEEKKALLTTLKTMYAGELPPTMKEERVKERDEISNYISDECIIAATEKRQTKETEEKKLGVSSTSPSSLKDKHFTRKHTTKGNQTSGDDDKEKRICVGLLTGGLCYTVHQESRLLFPNPSAYLGNIAVHPLLRAYGVGSALMTRFEQFVLQVLPLRAGLFLHYSPAAMVKVRVETGVLPPASINGTRSHPEVHAKKITTHQKKRLSPFLEAETELEELTKVYASVVSREQFLECVNPIVQHGAREVYLHCLADRQDLISFYEHRGYRVLRREEGYYSFEDGEKRDAVLMGRYRSEEAEMERSTERQKNAPNKDDDTEATAELADVAQQHQKKKKELYELKGEPLTAGMWLAPDTYASVGGVCLSSLPRCRYGYRRRKTVEELRSIQAEDNLWGDVGFIVNGILAIALLGFLLYTKLYN